MSDWQPMSTAPSFGIIEVTDDPIKGTVQRVERVADNGGGFWRGDGGSQISLNYWRPASSGIGRSPGFY